MCHYADHVDHALTALPRAKGLDAKGHQQRLESAVANQEGDHDSVAIDQAKQTHCGGGSCTTRVYNRHDVCTTNNCSQTHQHHAEAVYLILYNYPKLQPSIHTK
jgi:hypothetical protein